MRLPAPLISVVSALALSLAPPSAARADVTIDPSCFDAPDDLPSMGVQYGTVDPERQVVCSYYTGSGTSPVVVLVHGGAWVFGSNTGLHEMAGRVHALWPEAAIVSVGYRLDTDRPYLDQPADVAGAIRWIQRHPAELDEDPDLDLNPARMALFGFSSGGQLALLGAHRGTGSLDGLGRVEAVATWAAPTDLVRLVEEQGCAFHPCFPYYDPQADRQYLGWAVQGFEGGCSLAGCWERPKCAQLPCADPADLSALLTPYASFEPGTGCAGPEHQPCKPRYRRTSPIGHVDPSDPPTFLGHAVGDLVVPYDQATVMRDALHAAGVPHELEDPIWRRTRGGLYVRAGHYQIPDVSMRRLVRFLKAHV